MRTDALLPDIGIYTNDETGRISSGTSWGSPLITATVSENPNAADRFSVGCTLVDTTTGKQYANMGTTLVPVWNSQSDIIPSEIQLPAGQILKGDDAGIAGGVDATQAIDFIIENATGNTLPAGAPVAVMMNSIGKLGAVLASANGYQCTHFVVDAILDGATGSVYGSTQIYDLDTTTAAGAGSPVYLASTPGTYTFDTPEAGTNFSQLIGYVQRKDAVYGAIYLVVPQVTGFLAASPYPELAVGEIYVGTGGGTIAVTMAGECQVDATGLVTNGLEMENQTGSTILGIGTPVYRYISASGVTCMGLASSQGRPAEFFVTTLDLLNGARAFIAKNPFKYGIDTSSAVAVGSSVYLGSTPGTYVYDTPPAGADSFTQLIGYVTVKDATYGTIQFFDIPPAAYGSSQLRNDSVTAAAIGASLSVASDDTNTNTFVPLLYLMGVAGGPFVPGETVTGGTSAATGVVVSYTAGGGGPDSLTYTIAAGTFASGEVVTGGTSGATGNTAVDPRASWDLGRDFACITCCESNTGVAMVQRSVQNLSGVNEYCFVANNGHFGVQTMLSSAFTNLNVIGISTTVTKA